MFFMGRSTVPFFPKQHLHAHDEKEWRNDAAHHDTNFQRLPVGGIALGSEAHEG